MRTETGIYVDTSALAKVYLPERDSSRVQASLSRARRVAIDRLHVIELRSALSRRRRAGEIREDYEISAWRTFRRDIDLGGIEVLPLDDRHVLAGLDLIEAHHNLGLRPLDAVHLAIAVEHSELLLLTADRTMASIAVRMGVGLHLL